MTWCPSTPRNTSQAFWPDGRGGGMEPEARFMEEAMRLAVKARGRTHPNPCVGAVVVRDGVVVGRGYHEGPGNPHAEVVALREAGERAKGADLYVTLEPCCIYGRTPPCTEAILRAGVANVVACVEDPNPKVCGSGARRLREAGIGVVMGFLERQGMTVDPAYQVFHRKARPYVHLKWAQSLDGTVVPPTGGTITGEEARRRVHEDRFLADAILVSSGTVAFDDPRLTVRLADRTKPLIRVLLDSPGRLTGRERVFATSPGGGPVWVVCPPSAPLSLGKAPEGVEILPMEREAGGGFALASLLRLLRERQVVYLYVEAVGRLAGAFLREGYVDRLSVHLAPSLLGGPRHPGPLDGGVAEAGGLRLDGAVCEKAGRDWILTADLEGRCLPA